MLVDNLIVLKNEFASPGVSERMCRLAKHNDTNELQRLVALIEFLVLACLFMTFYKINEILQAACLVKNP